MKKTEYFETVKVERTDEKSTFEYNLHFQFQIFKNLNKNYI